MDDRVFAEHPLEHEKLLLLLLATYQQTDNVVCGWGAKNRT